MIDPKDFLTAQQVAEKLDVHVTFVYRLIREGRIEAFQIGNGYRISEEAYQKYLESTKVEVK